MPTRAPTWTPENTTTPTPEFWFYRYTIQSLRERAYGAGQLEITQKLEENSYYSRSIFRYPSDGVMIYGYAYIPRGAGPYSVIIMLHGASPPATYDMLAQNAEYARMYVSQGYIVLHPNLRNYPPSESGDNLFFVGMAVDVLNLIAQVKTGAGQAGLFRTAAPGKIGLWAFSMGGALAWRVLVVSPDVKAAFLYSPMSGDDYQNATLFAREGDTEAKQALTAPTFVFPLTSPQNFYKDITAAIDIHHGLEDSVIPVSWSEDACDQLSQLGKNVRCYFYENSDHVFKGKEGLKLEKRMINFFNTHFKNGAPLASPTP
jgi:uncharacterized protein